MTPEAKARQKARVELNTLKNDRLLAETDDWKLYCYRGVSCWLDCKVCVWGGWIGEDEGCGKCGSPFPDKLVKLGKLLEL